MMTLEINPPRHDRRDARATCHLAEPGPRGERATRRPRRLGPGCGRRQPLAADRVRAGWPRLHPDRGARRGRRGRMEPTVAGSSRRQPAVRRADRSDAGTGRGRFGPRLGRLGPHGAAHESAREPGSHRRGDRRAPDRRRRRRRPALARRCQFAGTAAAPGRPVRQGVSRPATTPRADRPPGVRPGRPAVPVHPDEREGSAALGAGAQDLGVLAQRLRRLQGDPGEFAITAFSRHGLLWADGAWWEIEPIGHVDEAVAEAVFCMAWVVARQFRRAGVAQAVAYARTVTATAVRPGRGVERGWPLPRGDDRRSPAPLIGRDRRVARRGITGEPTGLGPGGSASDRPVGSTPAGDQLGRSLTPPPTIAGAQPAPTTVRCALWQHPW